MRKDKYLLIFGYILTIVGIGGVVLTNNEIFETILAIGIVWVIVGFITKYRLDSGKIQNDERTLKIASKSIALSWYITLILIAIFILFGSIFQTVSIKIIDPKIEDGKIILSEGDYIKSNSIIEITNPEMEDGKIVLLDGNYKIINYDFTILNSYQILSIIFFLMLTTYLFGLLYFKNKKL